MSSNLRFSGKWYEGYYKISLLPKRNFENQLIEMKID